MDTEELIVNDLSHERSVEGRKRNLPVEPTIFLLFLSEALVSSVIIDMYTLRVCEDDTNWNKTMCSNLNDTIKSKEYPRATELLMVKSLIETVIPATISFFLGPWSDINGRKPLIIGSVIGYGCMNVIYAGMCLVNTLPATYLLFGSLPVALGGGYIAAILGTISYVTDVTKHDDRAVRLSLVDAAIYGGALVGNVGCTLLVETIHFVGMFCVSAVVLFLAALYLYWIPESIPKPQDHFLPKCWMGRNIFHWSRVSEVFSTCFKKRNGYQRSIILLLISTLSMAMISVLGEISMGRIFTNKKFDWTISHYTIYSSCYTFAAMLAVFGGSYITLKKLKLSEYLVIILAFLAKIIASIVMAISPKEWFLYIGGAVGAFSTNSGPVTRSVLSKMVPGEETGKIFSLTGSLEGLVQLISSPLYTLVYNSAISYFPGAFYFISTAIYSFNLLLIMLVLYLLSKTVHEGYSTVNPESTHTSLIFDHSDEEEICHAQYQDAIN